MTPTPTTHDIEKNWERDVMDSFNERTPDRLIQTIKDELAHTRDATLMEFIYAFGNYVPLGGDDAEPEAMAKKVTEIWGAHTKEEVLREVLEIVGEDISNDGSNQDPSVAYDNGIDAEKSRLRQAITNLREMK